MVVYEIIHLSFEIIHLSFDLRSHISFLVKPMVEFYEEGLMCF